MKYLKLFESNQSEHKIHDLCAHYNIEDYTINPDLSIDVDGDANFEYFHLTNLPIKFNRVTVDFYCYNSELTSFKNFPKYLGGNLFCKNSNIRTFEGFPEHVGGDFHCLNNPIWELWYYFRDVKLIELFNDYDIIRESGQVIILDRFNEFLKEIGKPIVYYITNYENK